MSPPAGGGAAADGAAAAAAPDAATTSDDADAVMEAGGVPAAGEAAAYAAAVEQLMAGMFDDETDGGGDDGTGETAGSSIDQLVAAAKSAFARGEFERTAELYTRALPAARAAPRTESTVLAGRSSAFARLSRQLRSLPASYSEARALYGRDPLTLAQLALKDAQRAAGLRPTWSRAAGRVAAAFFLLERFEDAEEAYLAALQLEPSNARLAEGLAEARRMLQPDGEPGATSGAPSPSAAGVPCTAAAGALAGSPASRPVSARRRGPRDVTRGDELECTLCLRLLYEPVTTSCGHSFCRGCLLRALDHGSRCPMCRTIVHGTAFPVSVTLQALLERCFAGEYAERRAEARGAAAAAAGAAGAAAAAGIAPHLPLFIMDVVLPGQMMALNIFEPRYRLLVRRCMEGDRRLGMVGLNADRDVLDVGCECEIVECEPQPDGRFYVEVVGRRRVRIESLAEQDGYRVAKAVYFADEPDTEAAPAGSAAATDDGAAAAAAAARRPLGDLAADVEAQALAFVESISATAAGTDGAPRRRNRVAEQMLQRAGERPTDSRSSPEALSWWVANLAHCSAAERVAMLRLTSTRQRLQRLQGLIGRNDPTACVIA